MEFAPWKMALQTRTTAKKITALSFAVIGDPTFQNVPPDRTGKIYCYTIPMHPGVVCAVGVVVQIGSHCDIQ